MCIGRTRMSARGVLFEPLPIPREHLPVTTIGRRGKLAVSPRAARMGAGEALAQGVRSVRFGVRRSSNYSTTHIAEGEQSRKKCIRLNALAHLPPIRKSQFRLIHQIERFPACESTPDVIVCFVSGLLKIDKGCSDPNQLRLKRSTIQSPAEP